MKKTRDLIERQLYAPKTPGRALSRQFTDDQKAGHRPKKGPAIACRAFKKRKGRLKYERD
jgi:hypothetical protein